MERLGASSRFEVLRRVGAGGMGVIYEARDRTSGERFAIKTLHEHNATALYRLKKEFRGLQDIAHPNLIQFRELVEENGEWFLVMELVDGCDARAYVRGSDNAVALASTNEVVRNAAGHEAMPPPVAAPRDYERLKKVIAQIASALAYLHAAGRVHRDIKPPNVLVDRTGRVVVLDLGLARLSTGGMSSNDDSLAGTIPYVSPEQVTGEPATAASDCYALGVLLFELLTGRWPFTGSPVQILHAKCSMDAPVSLLPPSTPSDVAELCTALLQRDPRQRPTAKDVLRKLAADEPAVRPSRQLVGSHPAFFGRERELERLRGALADVQRGDTRVVWVRGASGVGKSSLVKHFLEEVAPYHGALVLSSRCYERESVPFKAVDGVVDALTSFLRGLGDADVASFLPRHIVELCAAFPVLGRVPAVERVVVESRVRERGGDRRERAFAALREMLTRLGERRTVAVFIDDLQWGDVDSMRLLREVLRPPDSPPVLVILASRDEATVDPLVAGIEAEPSTFVKLEVDVLEPAAATRLARHLMEEVGIAGSRDAEAIVHEANGYPLHILELVKHSLSSRCEGAAVRLEDAIASRVDRLSQHQRELLRLVCLSAAPIPTITLQRAAEADALRLLADITALTTASLLKASGGQVPCVEPFHDRIREVVTSRLTPAELRSLHERLATALEQGEIAVPAEHLMAHFTGCEMLERAAKYAARAARESEDRVAFYRAAELYAFALEYGEHDAATRCSLLARRAYTLSAGGRPLDAAHAFRAAAELAEDQQRLDLERRCFEHLLIAGEREQGSIAAQQLLRHVGLVVPETRGRSIAALLLERLRLRLRGLDYHRRAESELDPLFVQRLDVLYSLSSGMGFVNPIAARAIQARFLREALDGGEPRRVALAYLFELTFAAFRGPRTAARVDDLYRRALATTDELGIPVLRGVLESALGMATYFMCDFPRALELFDRAEPYMHENIEMQWVDGMRQTYRLGMMWQLGRYRAMMALHRELLRAAEEQGNVYNQRTLLSWRSNHAWLVRDDPAAARASVASVARTRPATSLVQLSDFYALMSNSLIDLYELKYETAFERVEEAWPKIRQLHRVYTIDVESTYMRGCAAVAAGRTRPRAYKVANACAMHLGRLDARYARMLGDQIRAASAACKGDREAAIAALRAVIDAGDALDIRGQAMAARMRLAALVENAGAGAAEAEAYLRAQGVVSPRRFANVFTPGLFETG